MLKGTRIIEGTDAVMYSNLVDGLSKSVKDMGYEPVIFPSLWEQQLFVDKAGPEIVDQMWTFKDKGDRDVCLIPEVTALVQHQWKEHWSKNSSHKRIFYVNRCYRYENPQEGRYREFTQLGFEILGKPKDLAAGCTTPREEIMYITREVFDAFSYFGLDIKFEYKDGVKRGLDYYIEDGFEVEAPWLGAQKQVAGGGAYDVGVGAAIGIDRLMLALKKCEPKRGLEIVK